MELIHIPWCIAHRGARNEAPDNTRSAFERALNYPIDGIELDVQMSADGVPVLYHDQTLKRVGGGRRPIADLPYSQLRQLDWGGWFDDGFSGEPLMTLDQIMTLMDRCPRLLIEIKSYPGQWRSGHACRLTETAISMITKPEYSNYQDRLYILSFEAKVLDMAHKLAPHLPKVLNLTGREPFDEVVESDFLWAIDVQIGKLSAPMVRKARGRGLRIMTYTCNTPRQVAKAMRLGLDAIISDRPDWLTRHLGRS